MALGFLCVYLCYYAFIHSFDCLCLWSLHTGQDTQDGRRSLPVALSRVCGGCKLYTEIRVYRIIELISSIVYRARAACAKNADTIAQNADQSIFHLG